MPVSLSSDLAGLGSGIKTGLAGLPGLAGLLIIDLKLWIAELTETRLRGRKARPGQVSVQHFLFIKCSELTPLTTVNFLQYVLSQLPDEQYQFWLTFFQLIFLRNILQEFKFFVLILDLLENLNHKWHKLLWDTGTEEQTEIIDQWEPSKAQFNYCHHHRPPSPPPSPPSYPATLLKLVP